MNLKNKVVLITGAARRLGREIAINLADGGAKIVIHCNRSIAEAKALSEKIGIDRSCVVCADLMEPNSAEKIINETLKRFGQLDLLINNASIFYRCNWDDVTTEDWKKFMNINFYSPYALMQRASQIMGRGKIVNLCGYAAEHPYSNFLPYSVSKAALLNATYAMAKALKPKTQVNAISPRLIHFPGDENDETYQKIASKMPGGVGIEIEVVIQRIVELIENDSISGENIRI